MDFNNEVTGLAKKLHETLMTLFGVLATCKTSDLLGNQQFWQPWNNVLELCGQVARITRVGDTTEPVHVIALRNMSCAVFGLGCVNREKYTVHLLFAHIEAFMFPRLRGEDWNARKLNWDVPKQKLSTRAQWGHISDLLASVKEDLERIIVLGATVGTKWLQYDKSGKNQATVAWDLVLEIVREVVAHRINSRATLSTAPGLRTAMAEFLDLTVRFENDRSVDYNVDLYISTIKHLHAWAKDPTSVDTLQ